VSEGISLRRKITGVVVFGGVLVLLLVAPLSKFARIDHPLAGATEVKLCPLLPPAPLPADAARRIWPVGDSTRSVCIFRDQHDQEALTVTLSSTRQLSQPDAPADTGKLFDTWMKEVRASYGNGQDLPAPQRGWRYAASYEVNGRRTVLFEDRGVLVLVESSRIDAAGLARYAEAVQAALRSEI
jgi:hypothetical protein